jgi:hypothetical protein
VITAEQLAPNSEQAIAALRALLLQFTDDAFNFSTKNDPYGILACQQVGGASLQRLEIELPQRSSLRPGGSFFLGGMSAFMLSCESRSTTSRLQARRGSHRPSYGSVCLWCRYKPLCWPAASRPLRRAIGTPGRGSTKPRRAFHPQNLGSSSRPSLYYA